MSLHNPFFHRGPIRDPTYFVGRRHELEQTLALLSNAQSVSIVAPRRMGKTSLLLHLSNPAVYAAFGMSPARACFIFVDCEGWRQLAPDDLYALLMEELREALEDGGHQVSLPAPPAPMTYRAFEQAIRAVVRQQIQLIFVLDEFDTLSANPYLDDDFFSSLRALATRHSVAYVTASTRPLLDLTYAQSNVLSSPFFNFFAQVRLRLFSDDDASMLLRSLSAKGEWPFPAATIDWLRTLSGPHPLLLQIAGYHAFDHLATHSSLLDNDGKRRIQAHFTAEAEPHWAYFWNVLTHRDQRLLALLPLAGRTDQAGVQRLVQSQTR